MLGPNCRDNRARVGGFAAKSELSLAIKIRPQERVFCREREMVGALQQHADCANVQAVHQPVSEIRLLRRIAFDDRFTRPHAETQATSAPRPGSLQKPESAVLLEVERGDSLKQPIHHVAFMVA